MKVIVEHVSHRMNDVTVIGTVDGLRSVANCPYDELQKVEEEKKGQFLASVLAHRAGATGASNPLNVEGEFDVSMDEVNALNQKAQAKSAAALSSAAPAPVPAPETSAAPGRRIRTSAAEQS